jgi:hypothetical protein
MSIGLPLHRAHLAARFDPARPALLSELVPLHYAHPVDGLPPHVRAASAVRRFRNRLVVVQDDVNALAVVEGGGAVRAVLLPSHESGTRVFDDLLGNKHLKLDLEACVILPGGRLVAFGSGSTPAREQLVVWSGNEPPRVVEARTFYSGVREAVTHGGARLNVEGAVVSGERLLVFHRANDPGDAVATPFNAIASFDASEFARWLDYRGPEPRATAVMTVDLDGVRGVPFGFTDAVALDDERIVVLACAEDSASALTDGAVLGCRVGLLDDAGLVMADVHDAAGNPTLLKLEGIERRAGSSTDFDVAVDVDRASAPAMLGRLEWEWH